MGEFDKELLKGNIGAEGSYVIGLKDANVVVKIKYSGSDLDGEVMLVVKSKAGIMKLKELIPGKIDDMIFDFILKYLGV